MIASLMMYLRPETAAATANYWQHIRAALADRGIPTPETLENDRPEFEVWQAPDLVLSQTCGMPYRRWLADQVQLVGTPDYGLPGCPQGHYNSVIVVRALDPRKDLAAFRDARFAYNQTFSQSGFAAPHALARARGFWFSDRRQSHGHQQSARAVAERRADIAALDAVSWRLIQRYDDFAARLRVLCQTPPTPGLPYITGPQTDAAAVFDGVREAIGALSSEDRDILGLTGIHRLAKSAYLAIPNPPEADS